MPLHSTHDFQPCWGTLCPPPLLFRGRPPQSNCPPDAVPDPDHGIGLEAQNTKGGIPRLAPRGLAPPLHSLPPILDNVSQTPTSSCSKGSRGLSVQPRVLGIFTETTVSPGPSFRQLPSRYAIRAGRNLPDREVRYLRTVHRCYSPGIQGGRLISGQLSRSPVRSDYLISPSIVREEV